MRTLVRIGAVKELPPGKGKVVQIGGREVAVFNVEGRYYASLSGTRHVGGPTGAAGVGEQTACPLPGRPFDVAVEDSLAEPPETSPRFKVEVRGEDVLLSVPEELGAQGGRSEGDRRDIAPVVIFPPSRPSPLPTSRPLTGELAALSAELDDLSESVDSLVTELEGLLRSMVKLLARPE